MAGLGSGMTPGLGGVGDEGQSADQQLQIGLQLIQQSYSRRVEELSREVEHWKRVAQHHKQTEGQTREELQKANNRTQEMQRQLNEKNQEVASLAEARNVALNQIATLKKHAAQLQSFKKNISNMLQADTGLEGLNTVNVQGMLDTLPTMDSTFSSTLTSPAIDAFGARGTGTGGGPTPYFNGSDPGFGGGGSGYAGGGMGGGYGHGPGAGMPKAAAAPPAPAQAPEVTLDAATYYQQVKRVLEPEQFREFSANIKKLNAGQQSVEETLEKLQVLSQTAEQVREIFGEHRPFLFAQLQKLIRQAEEEARRQSGDGADVGGY